MQSFSSFNDVAFAILSLVFSVLSFYVMTFINKKKKEIESNVNDEHINKVIENSYVLIQSVVDEVSQTYVNSLKNSNAFSKEAQEKALEMAMSKVDEMLNDEYKRVLEDIYSDTDAWIKSQIESYILRRKTK